MYLSANNTTKQIINLKIKRFVDGDGIILEDIISKEIFEVRFLGIDAPEKAQAFGQQSKKSLSDLVFDRDVSVTWFKKDRYGRTVGQVLVNDTDVCLEQIKRGLAWHYKQYASEQPKEDRETYAQAELAAKAQSIGLWKDKTPIPPWEFRRQSK